MLYRVILTKNGVYKKTLHRCKTEDTSFINFNRIKDENVVLFEKKHINYYGIIPVEYKLFVVKDYDEDDTPRLVRNRLGKLIHEKPLFGIWTILHDTSYKIEENFWVYGFDKRKDRKSIKDIIKLLVSGMNNPTKIKQIVVVNNKLLINDEEHFEMVICKCKKDAQRLHHALSDAAKSINIPNLLFMGTANKKMCGDYYEIIHKNTNWDYTKIWRTSTRP